MSDLIGFLKARMGEDRERAEAGQRLAQHLSRSSRDPGNSRAYAAAIQREGGWAPDRVLAQAASTEAILAMHDETAKRKDAVSGEWELLTGLPADQRTPDLLARRGRLKRSLDLMEGELMALGAVMRRLADPYSSHPDYCKEWSW